MSATSPLPLRELQLLVWQLITAPEGVRAGARDLCRRSELASVELDFLVLGDERLDAADRLDIYADMYFYRLRDCLAEDYPKLEARIGAQHFHNLVTDYLIAHPSRHPSLRELGRALPDFLEAHPLGREFRALADLARLEWARVDVFDERDEAPLARGELLERGASDPEFRVGLAAAARRLNLDARVLEHWREPGAAPESEAREPAHVLVWRRDFRVFHRSLAGDEARCLAALAEAPRTLGQIGECLAEALHPSEAETAGARLAELLEGWLRDGLLVAPSSAA